jgi:hypothetical protein
MSGWRQMRMRRCATKATSMMTMATGEGGKGEMEGEVDMEG